MGFFDKLGAQITNAGRTVSQNVKNVSDSSSLNREINGHQKTIQQKYAEIGQLFYEKYCEAPECEFSEQVEEIKASMQEIARLQAEIKEVKARKAELVPIPEDEQKPVSPSLATMVCTKCGNTYDSAQVFCSICGEKLVPKSSVLPQEPATSEPEPPAETVTPETPESSEETDIEPLADEEIKDEPVVVNSEPKPSVVNLSKDTPHTADTPPVAEAKKY